MSEIESFDEAKRAAFLEDLIGFLKGQPVDLLPFDAVRERLRLKQIVDRGVQEVPLDRIVGSLGREHEFNRAFLPRGESLRKRWEEVQELALGSKGFPAVELYYVNDVYFVVDGHHRVSVAKSVGAKTIEGHVKEFRSPILLTPETSIEEVILKTGLVDFLETTGLQQETPTDFIVTSPKGYEQLLDHISVHRYYRGIETGAPVSWEDAVKSWQDRVYLPMIQIIRKHRVLDDFPGHTETDLYLFTMDHLHYLRGRFTAREVAPEQAVRHFAKMTRTKQRKESATWWKRKAKRKRKKPPDSPGRTSGL